MHRAQLAYFEIKGAVTLALSVVPAPPNKAGRKLIMGYLPMNLTILQLPAPSSNMTKAEYKEAYGIDLDAIDFKAFRVVIFGTHKYAIDQIKEVEGGFEIYFNGRIMSITDTVQVSDEVYDVANAKPLYWHGLDFYKDSTKENFECVVINNSPSPIDTIEKFIAWASSIEGVVAVFGNGSIKIGNDYFVINIIRKRANNIIDIVYAGASGFVTASGVTLTVHYDAITDNVNKLN